MRQDYFNPATYMLIDRVSGEELDVAIFVKEAGADYWEKVYAKVLAEYIGMSGSKASANILAYLIREKTPQNMVLGTVREIAVACDTTPKTVTALFNRLKQNDLLKMVRSGCYLITPKMIRYGSKTRGAMVLRLWGEL